MNKPIKKISSSLQSYFFYISIFFCAALFSFSFMLSQADSKKINPENLSENQIYIKSDSMSYDDQKLTSTYEGNVFAKQVDKDLSGDKMIVFYNQEKKVKRIEVFGNPAKYNQNKTQTQEQINARALYINYLKDEETLELKKNVYLGKTGFKSTSDSLIYKIDTGEVRAESNAQNKVEMILN